MLTARDLKKWLDVTYVTPVPTLSGLGGPGTTTAESVQLVVAPDLSTLVPQPPESYQAGNWSIEIAFLSSTNRIDAPLPGVDPNWWGSFPAYYPAWAHATLRGVTSEPLVLRGYYATTGVLGHKERYQWHLFEPVLDPELPAAQRMALEAANIRLIHIERQPYENLATVTVLGIVGTWRRP